MPFCFKCNTVLVTEGAVTFECACPATSCGRCKLRFKCYTSYPIEQLTLAEKMTLLYGQDGKQKLPIPQAVKDVERGN